MELNKNVVKTISSLSGLWFFHLTGVAVDNAVCGKTVHALALQALLCERAAVRVCRSVHDTAPVCWSGCRWWCEWRESNTFAVSNQQAAHIATRAACSGLLARVLQHTVRSTNLVVHKAEVRQTAACLPTRVRLHSSRKHCKEKHSTHHVHISM